MTGDPKRAGSADPPAGRPTRGLGRGLDALLPARREPAPKSATSYGEGDVFLCPVDKIVARDYQPRRRIEPAGLEQLAQSLREHGLLEPLVVRPLGESGQFELVAGERRWRAAQKAGLHQVLVVVRDVSSAQAFELALVENLQREDLDPIDFAEAVDRLLREHGYTQETLAQRLGKDRSTIANALRLLKLPEPVRERLRAGELSEGHARALLGVGDPQQLVALAGKVIRGKLSVRQTEALVRTAKRRSSLPEGDKPGGKSPAVRDLETRLSRHFKTRCEVRDRQGQGVILIRYGSLDELDRILDLLF